MKFILLLIGTVFVFTSFANDYKKYLIPEPKKITDNFQTSETSAVNIIRLSTLFEAYKDKDFVGELPLVKYYHGISEIKFEIDENLKNNQEYKIEISETSINLSGADMASLFYAKQTFLQLLEYCKYENKALPCIVISDYPDFERRGFMLDVSRNKVPTMESLYYIIDLLASWKINELQLYTEHTFAYKNHKKVWEKYSPLTAEEIQELDKYCQQRYIDLVPNQNSFGHLEYWLKYDEYVDLADCSEPCQTIWGPSQKTSLDPTNPKSFKLISELYNELLPNFSSKYFNIGCDETMELGLGRSKTVCDKEGKGKVYLDYLKKLNAEVNKLGKTTQFWGDIIINHSELIPKLPKNMIALVWGYEDSYSSGNHLPKFVNAGIDFYVCPGTSCWNSLIGRNKNGFENLKNAALKGKAHNAKGYLITNWGDYGHWQPLSISMPAIMLGSAYAWNYSKKSLENLEFLLNHYVFEDSTQNTAKAILKLGYVDQKTTVPNGNANIFHLMYYLYKRNIDKHYQAKYMKANELIVCEKEILDALEILKLAKPSTKDSTIIIQEIELAAKLAIHATHLGVARLEADEKKIENIPAVKRKELYDELKSLIETHKKLWIVRNREGGLHDSAGKMENLLNAYK